MKCNHCGESVREGDKYCKSCGSQIVKNNTDSSLAIASVIMGGLSILISTFFFPIAIIGLVLGICQKGKSSLKTIGIVLNSIGIAIALLVWIFIGSLFLNLFKGLINNADFNDFPERWISGESFTEEEYNDWNEYINLREGALGKEKTIEGKWRILGDRNDSLELKDGVFHYYLDANNKNDNYMMGTYEVSTAESKMINAGTIINNVIGDDLGFDNYYFIDFYPSKVIKDSKEVRYDKYEAFLAILDHKEEGIEAKLRVYDSSGKLFLKNDNYIKVSD